MHAISVVPGTAVRGHTPAPVSRPVVYLPGAALHFTSKLLIGRAVFIPRDGTLPLTGLPQASPAEWRVRPPLFCHFGSRLWGPAHVLPRRQFTHIAVI